MNKLKHLHVYHNYNPFKYLGNILQNVTFCWKKSVFLGSLVLQSKPISKRWINEYKYDDVNQLKILYFKTTHMCVFVHKLFNLKTLIKNFDYWK